MHPIKVAARDSLLSQVQVQEILLEIREFFPDIHFEIILMKTTGDLDLSSSLIYLEKTDFFTKELDLCVLDHRCDIAVHSAKDLPDPLPQGLHIYAITKGVDPSDVLALRDGEKIETLPIGAKIGTSSLRRSKTIQSLRSDFIPIDIRGNIQRRLSFLMDRSIDGLVVAEAALIRLGLTQINRVVLQGEISPMQGRLAVVGRANNPLLKKMFQTIHS